MHGVRSSERVAPCWGRRAGFSENSSLVRRGQQLPTGERRRQHEQGVAEVFDLSRRLLRFRRFKKLPRTSQPRDGELVGARNVEQIDRAAHTERIGSQHKHPRSCGDSIQLGFVFAKLVPTVAFEPKRAPADPNAVNLPIPPATMCVPRDRRFDLVARRPYAPIGYLGGHEA